MTIVLWVLIVVLFLLSFAGLIFPIVPSILVLWGGFLVYVFGIDRGELSIWFWMGAIALTLFILISDFLASRFFVKKYRGSKWGEWTAAIGIIIGSFIFPPFGIILVPFLLVFIIELILERDVRHAGVIAVASLIAFLSSTFAKLIIQMLLICWFFLEALL